MGLLKLFGQERRDDARGLFGDLLDDGLATPIGRARDGFIASRGAVKPSTAVLGEYPITARQAVPECSTEATLVDRGVDPRLARSIAHNQEMISKILPKISEPDRDDDGSQDSRDT